MEPDLSVLPAHLQDDLDRTTIEPFDEGIWFGWREVRRSGLDIQNAVWWTHDGRRIISLAMGSDLHYHKNADWENYALRGEAEGRGEDVCCHGSREEAAACTRTFMREGRFCSEEAS